MKICRFRDDVLVLASERVQSHAYGRGMIVRTGYFITNYDKINCDKLEYLNCVVWIENGTIQSRHFEKTNQSGEFL